MQIFYYLSINKMFLYMRPGPQMYANLQNYYQASHIKYHMKWLLCRMTNIISMMMIIIIIIIIIKIK